MTALSHTALLDPATGRLATYTAIARNVTFAEVAEIMAWTPPAEARRYIKRTATRYEITDPFVVMTKTGPEGYTFDWTNTTNYGYYSDDRREARWQIFTARDVSWLMFADGDTTIYANNHGGELWEVTVEVPCKKEGSTMAALRRFNPIETELYLRLKQIVGNRLDV